MRYAVLDTDVASRAIRHRLSGELAMSLAGAVWCVTFITVGELWQWAESRDLGLRTRGELEQWLSRVVILDSDEANCREWGRISARARRRGRPRPANDMWIAACCLACELPLVTLNLKHFEDFQEHEGPSSDHRMKRPTPVALL